MNTNFRCLAVVLLCLFSLSNSYSQNVYIEERNNVGDIPFNADTDNPLFELIDETIILPYNMLNGFHIDGERYRVLQYFEANFRADTIRNLNGYITIRFIVNHKGQTDRFRMYETNVQYQAVKFPETMSNDLMELTKNLDGWINTLDNKLSNAYICREVVEKGQTKYAYDYYQYITFKIKDGQIETILP